jgi:hypothetical protein
VEVKYTIAFNSLESLCHYTLIDIVEDKINLIHEIWKTNPKLENNRKVKIEHIENIIKYSFKSNNTIEEINIINNTPIISK